MEMDGSKGKCTVVHKDDFDSVDAPALNGITSCAGVNTEGAASAAKPSHITDEFDGAAGRRGRSQHDNVVYTRQLKSVPSEKKNNGGENTGDGEKIKAAITGEVVLSENSVTECEDGDDLDSWGGTRDSNFASSASRDAWMGLEEALGLELADSDTESSKNSDDDHDDDNNIATRDAWIRLEEALGLELADSDSESSRDSDDDNNNSQSRVMSSGEPSGEVQSQTTAEFMARRKVEEGDGEAPRIELGHGAYHGSRMQPVAEDLREGDQNGSQELDASDTSQHDSFGRTAAPYPADVISEIVSVEATSSVSFDCTAIKSAAVPPRAMLFTTDLKNNNTLLRRQVLVDDIISKLQESSLVDAAKDCDESENVVLVRGHGGIGKSVLCSMVVSNRSTLLHFFDGIAWLSLSQVRGEGIRGSMTYDVYVDYLESICNQLDLEVPTFNEPIVLAADSSSIRRQKEQAAMEKAKDAMCRLLSNRHILIVLDDVWSRSAVPWLNFSNRLDSHLRVLLSTRLQGGFRKAKAIDVGTLSLQEASTLLIRESGHASLTIEEESLAVDIVKRCSLPVAICIAGRMLASSNNRYEAFQELASEMSDVLALQIDPQDTMFDLTDRCFAGVGGESLKVSFIAFSVTFTTDEGKRAVVPAAAATKLLDALLLPEDRRVLACVNGTVLVLQQLHDMGLFERQGDEFKVRHDSGQEYAKQIMMDKRERTMLFTKRLSRALGKTLASKSTKSAETLVSALHLLFTKEYTSEINIESYCKTVADDGYLSIRLPWHVMSSTHHQSHLFASNILRSPSFLKRRVDAMGLLSCIKAHIHDIEMLDRKSQTTKEKNFEGTIDASFEVILDYIATNGVASHDEGRAYMLLALYFQQQCRFSNAMEYYSRAYVAFQREGLEEEIEWVQKRAEKIAFKPVRLVPKSASSEDIIRFDRVTDLLAQQEKALSGTGNSSNASVDRGLKLTLSSHPGMALCLSDRCQRFPGWNCVNLCIGPAESAISVKYEGDRFVVCNGGRSCLLTSASRGGEGDMLHIANYRCKNKTFSRMIDKMYGKTTTSDLVVNGDGSMSPRSRRDLVFAAMLPQFFLVKRDSPSRLILKHDKDLKTNQVPSASQDCAVSRDKIFSGELASHPGNAICHYVETKATSKVTGDAMKFGDVSDSVQFVYDGKKLATVIDGKCKYFLTNAFGVGDTSANQFLIRDDSRTIFKHEFEFGLHWIINDDGSLSPSDYPTHAIGLHSLSSTELLLTEEQRMLAKSDAKRSIRTKNRCQSLKQNLRFLCLISK